MQVVIWNENVHEKEIPEMRSLHPGGLHGTLAALVGELEGVTVKTATLDQPDAGLPPEVLDQTDVLLWWGHMAHHLVPDEVVERVQNRVQRGMGLIVLHSGHMSKIFIRLMGTTGCLSWRDDTYERLFCVNPNHPITRGLPECIELGAEECYGEPFDIPTPDELLYIGWFDIGEVFRSGCTWTRGLGRIFYFQPGHETNRSFYHPHVRKIIQNAVQWAAPEKIVDTLYAPYIEITREEARAKGIEAVIRQL